MGLSSAERLWYYLTCRSCGQATQYPLTGLIAHDHVICGSKTCGQKIDLKTPDNRALIHKLADYCADLDAILAKRD